MSKFICHLKLIMHQYATNVLNTFLPSPHSAMRKTEFVEWLINATGAKRNPAFTLLLYSGLSESMICKYKLEKISASLGVNTTSKDVSSQIYSGAVLGIILLQNIYELDVDKLAYGQLEYHGEIRPSNFNQKKWS